MYCKAEKICSKKGKFHFISVVPDFIVYIHLTHSGQGTLSSSTSRWYQTKIKTGLKNREINESSIRTAGKGKMSSEVAQFLRRLASDG